MEYTVSSDTFDSERMLALFEIEEVRLVVKTFLILDRIAYPAVVGLLTGTDIVILAVTGDLSVILPVTVKSQVLRSRERILAVYLESDIKNSVLCFTASDRIIDKLKVVVTRLFYFKLVCKSKLVTLPFDSIKLVCLEIGILRDE